VHRLTIACLCLVAPQLAHGQQVRRGLVVEERAVLAVVWSHDPVVTDSLAVFNRQSSFLPRDLLVTGLQPNERVESAIAVQADVPVALAALLPIDTARGVDSVPLIADHSAWDELRKQYGPGMHIVTITRPGFDRSHSSAVVIVFQQCDRRCGNAVRRWELKRVNGRWDVQAGSPMLIRE
jgi:hypothetical protein